MTFTLPATTTVRDRLAVGLPTVIVLLPVAWYLLVGVVYPVSTEPTPAMRERARDDLAALPPLSRAGRRTLLLFGATATLWPVVLP